MCRTVVESIVNDNDWDSYFNNNNSEKSSFVDLLGGVRYWHLRTDLKFGAGVLAAREATASTNWVDAIAGVRGKAHLSKKIFVSGKADVGGGGSRLTYQLFGGVRVPAGRGIQQPSHVFTQRLHTAASSECAFWPGG